MILGLRIINNPIFPHQADAKNKDYCNSSFLFLLTSHNLVIIKFLKNNRLINMGFSTYKECTVNAWYNFAALLICSSSCICIYTWFHTSWVINPQSIKAWPSLLEEGFDKEHVPLWIGFKYLNKFKFKCLVNFAKISEFSFSKKLLANTIIWY